MQLRNLVQGFDKSWEAVDQRVHAGPDHFHSLAFVYGLEGRRETLCSGYICLDGPKYIA